MKVKMRFFYLLIINSITSSFILYTSTELNSCLYSSALASVLIAFIINCINAYMMAYVYNYFKNLTFIDINKQLLGKFLGNCLSGIYAFFNIAISFFMFRGTVEIVVIFMLPSTPVLVIASTLIIVSYANVFNNTRTYLTYIGFITIIIILYTLIQVGLSFKAINFRYIQGVLTHSEFKPNFMTIALAGFFFSGVSHLSVFNPLFDKISFKKIILLFVTVGIPIVFISVLVPAGILGPVIVRNFEMIWISVSDTIQVTQFFIERVMFVVLPLFFTMVTIQKLNYVFVGYTQIKLLLPNPKVDIIIFNIITLSFVIGSVMIKNTLTLFKMGSFVLATAFYVYHITSLLLFICTKLKERKNYETSN